MQTVSETLRAAWPAQHDNAKAAFDLLNSWCAAPLARVPGMGTVERLAIRLHAGKTVEQAAAAEYLYRWRLAIKAPSQCVPAGNDWRDRNPRACISIFGTPHAIGL